VWAQQGAAGRHAAAFGPEKVTMPPPAALLLLLLLLLFFVFAVARLSPPTTSLHET